MVLVVLVHHLTPPVMGRDLTDQVWKWILSFAAVVYYVTYIPVSGPKIARDSERSDLQNCTAHFRNVTVAIRTTVFGLPSAYAHHMSLRGLDLSEN